MASPQKENGFTAIANELLEVVVSTPLPGRHKDVWFFVLRKTWGYGKKADYISLSQFVEGTGIDRRSICRIIKDLVAWNLLGKKGSVYNVKKDYSRWNTEKRGSARGVEDNRVGAQSPHTKETITKENTRAKARAPMKKNRIGSYREDESQDSHEEFVDIDTGEVVNEKKREPRLPSYKALIAFAVTRRKKDFMPHTIGKQFKALSLAKKYGITDDQLKNRWFKMEEDKFWGEKGFDWMNVLDSFNKKPR